MRKLKLDDLSVESFITAASQRQARGTVQGYGTGFNDWTCASTCPNTCENTCPNTCEIGCGGNTVNQAGTCLVNTRMSGCDGYTNGPYAACDTGGWQHCPY